MAPMAPMPPMPTAMAKRTAAKLQRQPMGKKKGRGRSTPEQIGLRLSGQFRTPSVPDDFPGPGHG